MAIVEVSDRPSRRSSPGTRISLLVIGALLLSGLSWFVGTRVGERSSGESKLTTPKASLVTARVEDRVVVASISGRASVGFADVVVVGGPPKGGRVTSLPSGAGDEVVEGQVLVEVDGRPTIALVGPVPMYRPLVVGEQGPDVLAFEQALERLGIDRGPVDGTFDTATENGVRALFARAGYAPVEPTAEQRAAYSAAQDAVTQARLTVLSSEHDVDVDRKGLDPGERAKLQQAIDAANQALGKAQRDAAALGPALDAAIAAGQETLDAAVAQAAAAAKRVDDLPDSTDAATRGQLESLRDQADAAVETARTTLAGLVRDRPNQLADAVADVATATSALDAARKTLADALVSKDRDLLVKTLQVAREALASAEQKLADQAAIVGAGVGVSEVVFFPSLPRRVQRVDAKVGDDAGGSIMQVSGGDPVGRWFVTAEDRALLKVGGAVKLSDSLSGLQLKGTIAAIAETPGDPEAANAASSGAGSSDSGSESSGGSSGSVGAGGSAVANKFLVTVAITRDDATPPNAELVGSDLLVSAAISESSSGLAVPLAAVVSRPDGSAAVRRATNDFDATDVPVTVGASGDGYAQIVPVTSGALAVGDRVVVGS